MYESLRFDFCTSYSFGRYLVMFFNQFSYTNIFGLQSNCCFQHFLCCYIPTNSSPLSSNTIWVCAMDCTCLSEIIWIFIAFCTYSIKMNSKLKTESVYDIDKKHSFHKFKTNQQGWKLLSTPKQQISLNSLLTCWLTSYLIMK